MITERYSCFKDRNRDLDWFDTWVEDLETLNDRRYEKYEVATSLGKTHVWGVNTNNSSDAIVIFPGARTSALFWDFDRGLDLFGDLRIFLVETNGLPNLSDGNSPDISSNDYGHWAAEVMEGLGIERAFVAGASFGGLICMKLAITNPEKIHAAFLLNPGCLQPFSLTLKNLYYNLLPIIVPTRRNVSRFLNKAVFCKPNHKLSESAENLILDYELFAITRYNDKTQKPYDMDGELRNVFTPTYLLLGDHDLLFPFKKSLECANVKIGSLQETKVYGKAGHGIETYAPALSHIGKTIADISEKAFNEAPQH